MCGVRSMELQAKVKENDILYVNYQNEVRFWLNQGS